MKMSFSLFNRIFVIALLLFSILIVISKTMFPGSFLDVNSMTALTIVALGAIANVTLFEIFESGKANKRIAQLTSFVQDMDMIFDALTASAKQAKEKIDDKEYLEQRKDWFDKFHPELDDAQRLIFNNGVHTGVSDISEQVAFSIATCFLLNGVSDVLDIKDDESDEKCDCSKCNETECLSHPDHTKDNNGNSEETIKDESEETPVVEEKAEDNSVFDSEPCQGCTNVTCGLHSDFKKTESSDDELYKFAPETTNSDTPDAITGCNCGCNDDKE